MSPPREDYYVVLQVQPDAEPEVIEAAYRQLMRKYHPDSAGSDHVRAAILHERAKAINQAYAVLRDPKLRWIYDRSPTRQRHGAPRPRPTPPTPPAPPTTPTSDEPQSTADSGSASPRDGWRPPETRVDASREPPTVARNPKAHAYLGLLAPVFDGVLSLYYLLPGPYEWEPGRGKDFLATCVLPLLGVAAWSLFSGRLAWLTGRGPYVGAIAWAVLALLALPLWQVLPRVALAGLPTILLLTGPVEGLLQLTGIPPLLAWCGAGVLGVLLSARLYLFAVLPTIVVCWTLVNVSPGQVALWSLLASAAASVSTGTLALLTLACLLGALTWITVIDWRRQSGPPQPKRAPRRSPSDQPVTPVEAPDEPLFRRISADRVRTLQIVPLRTDRNHGEPPTVMLAEKQEANVVLVRDSWAYLQTDDGREGWAEWRVAS